MNMFGGIFGSVFLLGSLALFYGLPFLILRSLLNSRLRQRDDRITELEFRIRTLEERLLAERSRAAPPGLAPGPAEAE
jgi:hypothetical protein